MIKIQTLRGTRQKLNRASRATSPWLFMSSARTAAQGKLKFLLLPSFRLMGMVIALSLFTSASIASPRRKPILSSSTSARETVQEISTYYQPIEVVRTRTKGKNGTNFYADPQLLDVNASALVTITSVSPKGKLVRFRCIATHDLAECLGTPVYVRYLPQDHQLVLSVQLIPRGTPKNLLALDLISESRSNLAKTKQDIQLETFDPSKQS